MSVGIPLPELDVSRPQPNPAPDALSEFARAAQLKTAAAQQQAIMAQTQGQTQQNQMQALQLKDQQTIHDLAPQFVQKDEKGKPTGFDNEGFANAARGAGVNPNLVNTMQNQYAEAVKNLAGATKAQVDAEKDKNSAAYEASESLRPVIKKVYGAGQPTQPAPGAQLAAQLPSGNQSVPGTGGMPSFMLPGAQPGAEVGDAKPGTPQSLGQAPTGEAATPSETALRPPNVLPEDMQAWHNTLMNLARLHVNIGSLNPNQIPTEKQLDSFQAGLGAHAQALADGETAAKTAEAAGKGKESEAKAEAEMWKAAGEGTLVNIKTRELIHGVAPPDVEAFKAYIAKGGDPIRWPAFKAQQEAAATQPYKIQTAEAEGKARQLIDGMGKSVYAFLSDGTHQLMSQTAALQTPGVKVMVPATEKQITDDILLNNRLADVQQKINNYDQALGKIGSTVTNKDQGNIAALISKGTFKVGAFGTEVPLDRMNAALQKENITGLSDDAIKLLAAYYNARESLVGYNRVLSGSSRGGEKQMEISMDTMPNPATTDPRYAKEAIGQFRQNLQVIGQGLPVIPGVKRPEEWSPSTTGGATAPTPKLSVGQTVSVKGKPMKVTAVHSDGSFDAK